MSSPAPGALSFHLRDRQFYLYARHTDGSFGWLRIVRFKVPPENFGPLWYRVG